MIDCVTPVYSEVNNGQGNIYQWTEWGVNRIWLEKGMEGVGEGWGAWGPLWGLGGNLDRAQWPSLQMLHILHCDSQKDNLLVFFWYIKESLTGRGRPLIQRWGRPWIHLWFVNGDFDIFIISIVEQQQKYSQRDIHVDTVIFQTR